MQVGTFYNRLQGLQHNQRMLDGCPREGKCCSLCAVLLEPQWSHKLSSSLKYVCLWKRCGRQLPCILLCRNSPVKFRPVNAPNLHFFSPNGWSLTKLPYLCNYFARFGSLFLLHQLCTSLLLPQVKIKSILSLGASEKAQYRWHCDAKCST